MASKVSSVVNFDSPGARRTKRTAWSWVKGARDVAVRDNASAYLPPIPTATTGP